MHDLLCVCVCVSVDGVATTNHIIIIEMNFVNHWAAANIACLCAVLVACAMLCIAYNKKRKESITCVQSSTDFNVQCTQALYSVIESQIKFIFLFIAMVFFTIFMKKKIGIVLLPRCSVSAADSQRNITWTTWWAISAHKNKCTLIFFVSQMKCCNFCAVVWFVALSAYKIWNECT